MIRRLLAIALLLASAAASVAVYANDVIARKPVVAYATKYTLTTRREDVARAINHAPTADLAAQSAAVGAVNDALREVKLGAMTVDEAELWIASMDHLNDELLDARKLLFDAIDARPLFAEHYSTLGRVTYAYARRTFDPRFIAEIDTWRAPLAFSSALAPGRGGNARFLAGATLEMWPLLPAAARTSAGPVFRSALADPAWARKAILPLAAIYGAPSAAALLPDDARVLDEAMKSELADALSATQLQQLLARRERAEAIGRAKELAAIEERMRYGDIDGVAKRCSAWVAAHPVSANDTPEVWRQTVRVLELWPSSASGAWPGDGRARVAAFALEGRRELLRATTLKSSLDSLGGVPDFVEARATLAAGDARHASTLEHASIMRDTDEWTPYLVDLARDARRRGDDAAAIQALARVPYAQRGECESVVLSRDVPQPPSRAKYAQEAWSANGSLVVCLPERGHRAINVTLTSAKNAVVNYGWDGGRRGAFVISANTSARLSLPTATLSGRHILRIWPVRETSITKSAVLR